MLTGVDVSRWQGSIDWNNLGADFAVIKSSGGDGGLYTDGMFMTNNLGAMRKGIPHGYYHFLGGQGAQAEADYFLTTLGQLDAGEFLALDYEIDLPDPVPYVRQMAQIIIDRIGVKPFIYLNSSLCNRFNWDPLVQLDCGLWIANYGANNGQANGTPSFSHWPYYAMWQYTSVGRVNGIAGNVDMNQFNGTREGLLSYGYKKPGTITPSQFVWDKVRYAINPLTFQLRHSIPLWNFELDYPVANYDGKVVVIGRTNILKGSTYYIPEGEIWTNYSPWGFKEEDLYGNGDDITPPQTPAAEPPPMTPPAPDPPQTPAMPPEWIQNRKTFPSPISKQLERETALRNVETDETLVTYGPGHVFEASAETMVAGRKYVQTQQDIDNNPPLPYGIAREDFLYVRPISPPQETPTAPPSPTVPSTTEQPIPPQEVPMPTADPTPKPKVIAATLGAASVMIIAWLVSLAGIDVPVLVQGSMATIAAFVFGYITSDN